MRLESTEADANTILEFMKAEHKAGHTEMGRADIQRATGLPLEKLGPAINALEFATPPAIKRVPRGTSSLWALANPDA